MKSGLFSAVFLACFLLPVTAFAQEGKTYTVKIEDGSRIIESRKPLYEEPVVRLEYYRQIGVLEGDDERYLLFDPYRIGKDSRGNIYISERSGHCIKVYDSDLNYLRTIGRKGQGPGEFEYGASFEIINDTLYVKSDINAISILTLDGNEIRRLRFTSYFTFWYITSEGQMIRSYKGSDARALRAQGKELDIKHFQVYTFNDELVRSFGDWIDFGNKEKNSNFNIPSAIFDERDYIYVYFRYNNRIEKYSPSGELIFRSYWPLDYEYSYVGANYFVGRGNGIDHKGRIWVRFNNTLKHVDECTTDDLTFAVFDENGILLCYVPLPRIEGIQIIGASVFFINHDDTYCIYEYKIVDLQ